MRRSTVLLAFALTMLPLGYGAAETGPSPAEAPKAPVNGNCATADRQPDSKNLSDKLAQSKGVLCPPAALDSEMQKRPPAAGALDVIPPPGSPGGDPKVQPK